MGEGGVSSVWLSEGNTRQLLHCVNPLADLAPLCTNDVDPDGTFHTCVVMLTPVLANIIFAECRCSSFTMSHVWLGWHSSHRMTRSCAILSTIHVDVGCDHLLLHHLQTMLVWLVMH